MGNNDKVFLDIVKRLERLEQVVFGDRSKNPSVVKTKLNFTGTKGGILFLLSQDYFNQRRTAPAVQDALKKEGYDYSIQAVQTALKRLSKSKGPLVVVGDGGKKVYVKRK